MLPQIDGRVLGSGDDEDGRRQLLLLADVQVKSMQIRRSPPSRVRRLPSPPSQSSTVAIVAESPAVVVAESDGKGSGGLDSGGGGLELEVSQRSIWERGRIGGWRLREGKTDADAGAGLGFFPI
jgi:hypothetical protein